MLLHLFGELRIFKDIQAGRKEFVWITEKQWDVKPIQQGWVEEAFRQELIAAVHAEEFYSEPRKCKVRWRILRGCQSLSPGLRGTSYPGQVGQGASTLKGLDQTCSSRWHRRCLGSRASIQTLRRTPEFGSTDRGLSSTRSGTAGAAA
ncbi:MAG: hypothetical protein KGS61_03480 [Verrucomicrobia bacterium]|nr:hypothetical protein [Verrucomicrobiota bacterium]